MLDIFNEMKSHLYATTFNTRDIIIMTLCSQQNIILTY